MNKESLVRVAEMASYRGGDQRSALLRPMNSAADFATSDAFLLAPIAYSVIDFDGHQIAANPAFRRLFGTEGVLVDVHQITSDEDQERTRAYLSALRDGSQEVVVIDKLYRRADDTQFWGRLTATAARDDDGEPRFLIGTIEDQSEQVRALARAQEASEAKSQFVARVSHELRTPLHAVQGLAELLALADLDADNAGFVEAIHVETVTVRRLVDDLLDISRLEAGGVELQEVNFSIAACVAQAVSLLRVQVQDSGVELTISIDPAVDRNAMGDPNRLQQVLRNLADNAVKFTKTGRVDIVVAESEAPGDVRFAVIDTGTGIGAADLQRIFEPYSRVDESLEGTGLGLSIVRDLVELMGGSITVDSRLGSGSTFEVTLPLPEPDGLLAEIPAAGNHDEDREDTRPHVLVVEDSQINQLLAAGQLDRLGCKHLLAPTGFDALRELETHRFDLVLMDWHLPDMDGLETTRRWRAQEAAANSGRVPIVAVTARAMTGDREQCIEAGMDDFLAKPVGLEDLARVVRDLAGKPDLAELTPRRPQEPSRPSTNALDRLIAEFGDHTVAVSLLATFLGELPKRCDALRDAFERDEFDLLRRTAHTLKSTSATVGASDLQELTAQIERCSAEGDQELEALVSQLADVERATEAKLEVVLEGLQES